MTNLAEILGLEDDHPANKEQDTFNALKLRITTLNVRSWEQKLQWSEVSRWLQNFDGKTGRSPDTEQLHALFLLSQFMYFGSREVRVLLKSLYKEMILVPFIQRARTSLGGTRDVNKIEPELKRQLSCTRILGIGSPAESGTHLLYFFRQENLLSKDQFLSAAEIIKAERDQDGQFERTIRYPDVTDYFFIDDVCGSGDTAKKFSENVLEEISFMAHPRKLNFHYYCMFATQDGINTIRKETIFGDNAAAIYELDDTFESLSATSRFLKNNPNDIDPDAVKDIALQYGDLLWPGLPGGYDDNQLILGFGHNTPDNTLPIFWGHPEHGATIPWNQAFQRHWKIGY